MASPSFPETGWLTATATRYTLTSNVSGPTPMWKSSRIRGSPTATMLELSGARKLAAEVMAMIRRGLTRALAHEP